MASVQFRGIAQVIKAFNARKAEVWSLWHGKDYSTKGEGVEDLKTFLSMLDENSRIQYRLKVYDDVKLQDVKEKTESDGSFSFCLQDDYDDDEDPKYRRGNNRLFKEMDELRGLVSGFLTKEEKDEPETLGSVAMDLLRNPTEALQLVNVFNAITGRPLVEIPATMQSAAIGSISDDEARERGAAAIDILGKNDSHFIPHLEKLAKLSEENPKEFNFLLTLLDRK